MLRRRVRLPFSVFSVMASMLLACGGDDAGDRDAGATLDSGAVSQDSGPTIVDAQRLDSGPTCGAGQELCGAACVTTASDRLHCGDCDTACGDGEICVAGACATSCPSGQTVCGERCVDVTGDRLHCGDCDTACGTAEVCVDSACALECPAGLTTCDPDGSPYCANTDDDPSDCGGCGLACPASATEIAVCAAGTCRVLCADGFGDCDGDTTTSCETDFAVTATSCGFCGNSCPGDAALGLAGRCVASACETECAAGYADCDGDTSNGCEVRIASSPIHCGACGTVCPLAQVCAAGSCSAPTDGALRIVPEPGPSSGRLEVFHTGVWGTVCDDLFNANDNAARVACRQLGWRSGVVRMSSFVGDGADPILLDDVMCAGTEPSIDACGHRPYGTHNCGHAEDVGVTCSF